MSQEVKVIEKHDVVIRFSGDSGDGMQLAGNIFSTVHFLTIRQTFVPRKVR